MPILIRVVGGTRVEVMTSAMSTNKTYVFTRSGSKNKPLLDMFFDQSLFFITQYPFTDEIPNLEMNFLNHKNLYGKILYGE